MSREATPSQPRFNNQRQEGRIRFEKAMNREFTPLGDPLEKILAVLLAQKKITELAPPADPKGRGFDPSKKCAYHSGAPGHDTENCWKLKHKIQNLIDSGDIVVEQQESPNIKANPLPEHRGGGINVIETTETGGPVRLTYVRKVGEVVEAASNQGMSRTEPLKSIGLNKEVKEAPVRLSGPRPITIAARVQMPITSLKAVPWNYGGESGKVANCASASTEGNPLYLPSRIIKKMKRGSEEISEEKTREFLERMNQGEVNVVRSLEKEPPLMSILDLVLASPDHCQMLIKVLGEAHIPKTTDKKRFNHLVSHVLDSNVISFTDDDIPTEGRGHQRPLHIAVISSGYLMNGVLIDGGSALNICPLSTLEKMNVNMNRIRASHLVVRAFDGSRKETLGEIELPIEIGPYTFDISFQVLDIAASYNMLLGRPWIHMAGAVPSTLHQQIKFIINGNLITINAEPHCPPPTVPGMPVINLDKSIEPISYQALEVSTPRYQALGAPALKPKISSELTFAAREMMMMNFQPGQGLGRNGQGIRNPVQLPMQSTRAGLGYRGGLKQGGSYKKIPIKVAGVLIPKIVKSTASETAEPAVEAEKTVMSPSSEKLAKQEEFLREVEEKFESKCHLSGTTSGKEKQSEASSSQEAQPAVPFINWAELIIPRESFNNDQNHVAVIIKEVHDEDPLAVSLNPANLNLANWTLEPVVARKG